MTGFTAKMSNYDGGFSSGLTVRGLPLSVAHPGKVFFVGDSSIAAFPNRKTGSDGNKGSFTDPFATIDKAVGQCTANRGDIIYVLPGHTETVTAAGGLDLDVAGIAVVGLGSGSDRPQVDFTTATGADMDVDAANVTVANLLFTGGIDALTGPIDVNSADFTMLNCELRDVTGQANRWIVADSSADRMHIEGLTVRGASGAGSVSAVQISGAVGYPTIKNFWIDGNWSTGVIEVDTGAVTNMDIRDGVARTRNSADVFFAASNHAHTGNMGPNLYIRLADDAANITEAIDVADASTAIHVFPPVEIVNADNELSMEWNGTESTDA